MKDQTGGGAALKGAAVQRTAKWMFRRQLGSQVGPEVSNTEVLQVLTIPREQSQVRLYSAHAKWRLVALSAPLQVFQNLSILHMFFHNHYIYPNTKNLIPTISLKRSLHA
jgi:hypothetical protein